MYLKLILYLIYKKVFLFGSAAVLAFEPGRLASKTHLMLEIDHC
jgi:hypothetical protein